MSHEISIRNSGFAEMAFAGQLPWHGLGQRVDENASVETWRTQAGLDWTVESATVQYAAASALRSFDDRRVLFRSDTGAPLSVVSDGYRVVQPAEVLEFFRDLTQAHGFKIHTAGVLKGGRKIWALARNGHIEEAAPGDKLRGNLLLATSTDSTMQTVAMWTAIRVVCANTLAIALNGDTQNAVRTSHRTTFKADETKAELGALDQSFTSFAKSAQAMAGTPITQAQAKAVLNTVFKPTPIPQKGVAPVNHQAAGRAVLDSIMRDETTVSELVAKSVVREHRAVAKVLELYNGAGIGATHGGSMGTAWGLVNAVTEYVDHHAGRSDDTRIDSAWFGQGATVKQHAIDLLLQKVAT